MNPGDAILVAARLLLGWITGKRIPLMVTWNVTYRCNLDCRYCGVCREEVRDADTDRVLEIVDHLAHAGTRFLELSGGEPLMRTDIGQVIDACSSRGIHVLLSSNGLLIPQRLPDLGNASEIQISLDGTREVHDAIRGTGTFDQVVEAVERCKEAGINVCFSAVISRFNAERLSPFLDRVEDLGPGVYFQPVDKTYTPGHTTEADYYPDRETYLGALDWLLVEKRKGRKSILNSEPGLRHLRQWPTIPATKCHSSRFMCTIDPDGSLFVCDMFPAFERYTVQPGDRFAQTLQELELPHPCPRCLSSSMAELNLAASGSPQAIWGLARRLLNYR